jgi:hypothetical protein
MPLSHPYNGLSAAIATMHGKERVVAPVLAQWFDLRIERAEGVDTDALGTFSGEIERKGDMLETARAKARLAIERSGARFGLGSEGAFGPHPLVPLLASGLELMLLVDAEADYEISAHRRTRTNYGSTLVRPDEDVAAFLLRVGFPEHAMIVRPERGAAPAAVAKGIVDGEALREAICAMAAISATGRALVMTDMRAHLNPTRMRAIQQTTKALALRLARLCPACHAPGFGLSDVQRGLPCGVCGAPTDLVQSEIHACNRCGHREPRRRRPAAMRADPSLCAFCNP